MGGMVALLAMAGVVWYEKEQTVWAEAKNYEVAEVGRGLFHWDRFG